MKEIKPIGAFEGEFELPGDKSITHRAVMLNAGAEGEAVVTHALMGGDCLSTCQCMRALGARIDIDGTTLCVHGTPRFRTGVRLNCGNSGTTMRLLTALPREKISRRFSSATNPFPGGRWRAWLPRFLFWARTSARRKDTRPCAFSPRLCGARRSK